MKNGFTLMIVMLWLLACTKDATIEDKEYPVVRTNEVTNIDSNGATFSAQLVNRGTQEIIDFGFILKIGNQEGSISLFNSTDIDHFQLRCKTDILLDKIYTVRAYVTTTENLVKGTPVQFTGKGSLAPEIENFEPKRGGDGTAVKLYGKNFSIHPNNNQVYLNGKLCELLSHSQDFISIRTPVMKFFGDAEFEISTSEGKVTLDEKFEVIGPKILDISSTRAFGGDYLIIKGEDFLVNGNGIEVTFNDFNAKIIHASTDQVQVAVPIPYNTFAVSDILMSIKVLNGQKEAQYDKAFFLRKSWEEKAHYNVYYNNMYGVAFSYGAKGYLINLNLNKLLEYDSELDQWSIFADYHEKYTSQCLFVENDGKILQFGGGKKDNFWEFDVNAKLWHQKGDVPFYFDNATHFRLENVVYIITNKGQFWKYNLTDEGLIRLNNFPETFENFAFAFVSNGIPYAITYGTTWQYDVTDDEWKVKAYNTIHKSSYSVDALGFMLKGQCYILQNGEELYKYDLANGRWLLSERYPGCRGDNSIKTTFLIDDKIYLAAVATNYGGCAPLLYCFER